MKTAVTALAAISMTLTAVAAQGATFNYSFDAGVTWNNAIFVYGTPTSTPGAYLASQTILTGPLSGTGSFDIAGIQEGDIYAFVDTYVDAAGGLHIGEAIDPTEATGLIGSDFQTAFGITESYGAQIIGEVQSGSYSMDGKIITTSDQIVGPLFKYVPTYSATNSAPILGWSQGSQVGTVTSQAVPEPASLGVLALGIAALIKKRRR